MRTQQKFAKISDVVIVMLFAYSGVSGAQNEDAKNFSSQQVNAGSKIYAQTCAPCHGVRMADPEGAFDLRKFPRDGHDRFITSVTKGKNSMPPWGSLLSPDEVESLWAYVMAGERQ